MIRSRLALLLLAVGLAGVASCDDDGLVPISEGRPDARLRTHVVMPSSPTPTGLAYLEAVAALNERADAAESPARLAEILREGLALPVPAGLGEAEILRLELAARLCETLLQTEDGAPVARDLLAPMLAPERSLPVDRSTARALIVLGDAAATYGDDALAVGSYSRAIEVMSLLRQELEP
jgi:hypothetical protein